MKHNTILLQTCRKVFEPKNFILSFAAVVFASIIFLSGCGGGGLNDVLSSSSSILNQGISASDISVAELGATASEFVDTVPIAYFSNGQKIADSGAKFLDMVTCQGCHSEKYATFVNTKHGESWKSKTAPQAQFGGKSMLENYAAQGRKYCVKCHTLTGAFIDVYESKTGKFTSEGGKADFIYTPFTPAGKPADIARFGLEPIKEADLAKDASGAPILKWGGVLGTPTFEDYTQVPTEFQGIQCESCHGPASKHVNGGADRGLIVGKDRAMRAMTCAPCHAQYGEWAKSVHAKSLTIEGGVKAKAGPVYYAQTRNGTCAGCHTAEGFMAAFENNQEPKDFCMTGNNTYSYCSSSETNKNYGKHSLVCAVCHDPHSTSKGEHQLRAPSNVLCGKCHNARYRVYYDKGVKKYDKVPGAGRGPHQPQLEVFAGGSTGNGGVELDANGAMSAYGYSTGTLDATAKIITGLKYKFVNKGGYMGATSCPDCHMAKLSGSKGHEFSPPADEKPCQKCHPNAGTAGNDKNIKEIREKFENNFKAVAARLTNLLDANGVKGGGGKATTGSYACSENVLSNDYKCCNGMSKTKGELRDKCSIAEYNLYLLEADKSEGVHNKPYADYLLKVSGDILTGLGY